MWKVGNTPEIAEIIGQSPGEKYDSLMSVRVSVADANITNDGSCTCRVLATIYSKENYQYFEHYTV
jgi:hypothetical protein